jgi:hypothetical protein
MQNQESENRQSESIDPNNGTLERENVFVCDLRPCVTTFVSKMHYRIKSSYQLASNDFITKTISQLPFLLNNQFLASSII